MHIEFKDIIPKNLSIISTSPLKEIDMYNMRGLNILEWGIKSLKIYWSMNLKSNDQWVITDLHTRLIFMVYENILWLPLHLLEHTYDTNRPTIKYKWISYMNPWYITSSWSQSNALAIYLMHEKFPLRKFLLSSFNCHDSIRFICESRWIDIVYIQEDCDLENILTIYHNKIIWCVLTFWTTQLGENDSLMYNKNFMNYIDQHNIPLHIDAAYWGYIQSLLWDNRIAKHVDIISSITIDPHKFITRPWSWMLILPWPYFDIAKESKYFDWIWTYLWTTADATSAWQALITHTYIWTHQLKKIAQTIFKTANRISEEIRNIWYTVYEKQKGSNWIISILLHNKEDSLRLQFKLRTEWFLTSLLAQRISIFRIQYWIRIVVSPDPISFSKKNIQRILHALEKHFPY